MHTTETRHEPPTIEELYGRAIGSSHLELRETRCSVDYLIAAGWLKDGLGAKLFRLRTEWDGVRGEHRHAEQNARRAVAAAGVLSKAAAQTDSAASRERHEGTADRMRGDAAATRANAAAIVDDAKAAAVTARALILTQLKSLRDTSAALHNFAVRFSIQQRFAGSEDSKGDRIQHVTSRALDLWLDANCPTCDGKGYTGGFNAPRVLCTDCDATGKRANGRRAYRMGTTDAGQGFGRALLIEMDRKAEAVQVVMRRYTDSRAGSEQADAASEVAALHGRLDGLRSVAANVD